MSADAVAARVLILKGQQGSTDMKLIHTGEMTEALPASVVCLGYFDGVHRGHQLLITTARDIAEKKGLTLCVHALDRSPLQAIHPELRVPELTTLEEKARLFEAAGVDVLALTTFDDTVRQCPGKAFFERILLGRLNARAIVVGDDHRFGYRGDTGGAELAALCEGAGVRLTIVPRLTLEDGTVISSSAIRAAIGAGRWERAREMLGRLPDEAMIRRCAENFPADQAEAGQEVKRGG